MTESKAATEKAPWFDKLIPIAAVVGLVSGAVVWYYTSPDGYVGLWPVIATLSAFLFPGLLLFSMGELTDD